MMDEDPCGTLLEIRQEDMVITAGKIPEPGTILVCSRQFNHTPKDEHSDGVTDWKGDEAP